MEYLRFSTTVFGDPRYSIGRAGRLLLLRHLQSDGG
ncbi:Uncharacterised protein [Vibrio cholerae]|nr:Uncharacterised protein [Vibrio cholerae]